MSAAAPVIIVALVLLVAYLAFKLVADKTKFNELREQRDEATKKARGLADREKDLEAKLAQRAQEAGSAKDSQRKASELAGSKKEAKTALRKLENELKSSEETARKVTSDLNRVRQEKEQQRQELEKLRERLEALGDADRRLESLESKLRSAEGEAKRANAAAAEARAAMPPPADPDDPAREERLVVKLTRDVDGLKKALEAASSGVGQWKAKALESESGFRRLQKKYADTQSVLNITQNNLDLALDEIHEMKSGSEPAHPRADKSRKRAALKPKEAMVAIKDGPVIDLTANVSEVAEPKVEEVAEPKAEAKAEPTVEAQAEPEDKPLVKSTTVKRVKKVADAAETTPLESARPKAPPRPTK